MAAFLSEGTTTAPPDATLVSPQSCYWDSTRTSSTSSFSSHYQNDTNYASTPSPPPVPPPIRRKPLPPNVAPLHLTAEPTQSRRPSASSSGHDSLPQSATSINFSVRDLDRFPHGHSPKPQFPGYTQRHHRVNHSTASVLETQQFRQPTRARLTSEPLLSGRSLNAVIQSLKDHKRSFTMALHPPQHAPSAKPPPLRVDSSSVRSMSNGSVDYRPTPKTPGSKITSFFGWKTNAGSASPGNESCATEISDSALSPVPSPMTSVNPSTAASTVFTNTHRPQDSFSSVPKMAGRSQTMPMDASVTSRLADMEHELREISSELAGSIRREMELEDIVERMQLESSESDRRGSEYYFSDSGQGSSVKDLSINGSTKTEDIEKLKRAYEQERAQLKIDLSQKWQEERSRRQVAESHVQLLESQISQFRREKVEASNAAGKSKELEAALEDTRRRLTEERQLKDNMEDLLTGMRVELEQQKLERDQLQAQMQQDMQNLRNENSLLSQSRRVPPEVPQSPRIDSIAEEAIGIGIGLSNKRASGGLSRSNSLARIPPVRNGVTRSGSLSRPASMIVKGPEFHESLVNQMKDVETQRDALHQTVKSLLERQSYQARQHEKRLRLMELELYRARQANSPRKRSYERDVKNLREEINLLRRRADDALDQKWQCEKGLAGLKMDLDRAEQETSSLRALLQDYDIPVPHMDGTDADGMTDFHTTASSLEEMYEQLKIGRENAEPGSPIPNEDLENEIKKQVASNASLRARLADAISQGEREQKLSATKINEMQSRLKSLEEMLMLAQQRSEEEVGKHEQEVSALMENHNALLLRAKDGVRSPMMLSPVLPNSPFPTSRSPRLTKTTSGEAQGLNQVAQIENLESKVRALEQALRDADAEMGEVVSRMNTAQMQVAELQSDRDEALRQTRRLQAQIQQC
ncbi:hypothetical protein TEQG_03994 [Trichophyton equinum CBS 127.97]|uniref:DUF7603 domain-containing protein n=1 Tax=Trichophyton equinum (strain ATCC MYA-4606 / CBS 127.97) TaxID=559882 RepID=F2PS65_TRIEC|nr:hypothetical protein TEQG_03994 [Trichophyton equinum CBS 127.97]